MTPDLPEKLLGISLDEPDGREPSGTDETDEEDLERFLFFTIGGQRLATYVDEVRTITDPPEEVTRVPRSPPAIEGVTDLRGEITAIVDSRVHFPTDDDPPDDQRLLVFDRPGDRQSAAMRIDDVLGVETVPERNVLDRTDVESSDFSGEALEHPLVVALVEQERVQRAESEFDPAASRDDPTGSPIASDAGRGASADPFDDAVGATRSEGDSGRESTATSAAGSRTVVAEATALVDVDRLLQASGRPRSERR